MVVRFNVTIVLLEGIVLDELPGDEGFYFAEVLLDSILDEVERDEVFPGEPVLLNFLGHVNNFMYE